MTILAFDPARRTNAQAIYDAHELGYINDDDFVLDLTYGEGKFWKLWEPPHLSKNDLDEFKGSTHFDFRHTPWLDGDFSVVVFDPPYGFRGTSKHKMDESYGLGEYLSVDERLRLMFDGMSEAARLTTKYVLFKLQDQVVSGQKVWQRMLMADHGQRLGRDQLELVDELHVVGYRSQPQRKCKACNGDGRGLNLPVCTFCGGSGKVDMVQKHSASNVSTLQCYRKVK